MLEDPENEKKQTHIQFHNTMKRKRISVFSRREVELMSLLHK